MLSIDIKRKEKVKFPQKNSSAIINTSKLQKKSEPISKTKIFHIQSYLDSKQVFTILVTFVLTFVFSLATSQGLAKMNNQAGQNNVITESSNSSVQKLSVTNTPDTLALDEKVITDPTKIYLPIEQIDVPDPLKDRKEFLKAYLQSKHSVLADHVDVLSEQTQWKLIIAISRAESSYCKKNSVNNCWGIGGAWNLKKYSNYDQAISDVNRILEQHYIQV